MPALGDPDRRATSPRQSAVWLEGMPPLSTRREKSSFFVAMKCKIIFMTWATIHEMNPIESQGFKSSTCCIKPGDYNCGMWYTFRAGNGKAVQGRRGTSHCKVEGARDATRGNPGKAG